MHSMRVEQERPLRNGPQPRMPLVLLALSSSERTGDLRTILKELGAECLCVRRCSELRSVLLSERRLSTVVTDTTLEDANWSDVVRAVVDQGDITSVVVVAAASVDEVLWSEAMWRGVHDILIEPYNHAEPRRCACHPPRRH